MAEPRQVTCAECGFQAEDRSRTGWTSFSGDMQTYTERCRYLDEAPDPPADIFYCIALRVAAKRAATWAEIETNRP